MIRNAEAFVKLLWAENEQTIYAQQMNPSVYRCDSKWSMPILRWGNGFAHNKTAPLEVLHKLARDSDPGVRAVVASKNKLTPDLTKLLKEDEDPCVKQRIAYNKNADDETIRLLENDSDVLV